ncbi:hypothetical protein R3P38DRAFT_3303706 [Favolaschia claudopus]|uniref:Ribosomal protein S6 n=1 Tax=Favolaschia claudopus TaxID=2862362 RepID=A0AAW0A9W9_9AGAR
MPIYQMLCIAAHFPEYKHIQGLVRQSALHIMDAGGVVRKIESIGTRNLPQPTGRCILTLLPRTLLSLNALMRRDPRVVRWTVLKLGSKPEDIAKQGSRTIMGDSISTLEI